MYLDELSKYIAGLPQLMIALGLARVETFEDTYPTLVHVNVGAQALHLILLIIGVAILPYLLGSVSVPRFYCRKAARVDIYACGTQRGELGDVWRYVGKGHFFACLGLELVKVLICLTLGFFTFGTGDGADGAAIAALFCILGEILPVWHKMKGSRGFETAAICILILAPMVFAVLLLIYLIVLLGMRFTTAARLFPTLLYPLIASAFMLGANPTLVLLSVGVTALMVFSHWGNIMGMLNREEPRIEFRKKKKAEEE